MRFVRTGRLLGFGGALCLLRGGTSACFQNYGNNLATAGLTFLSSSVYSASHSAKKEDRLLHLIWVHVLYTLQNSSRSAGAPLSRKDLLDLSDRLLNRLSCSKGPISKSSRECINKRKAELALLRSSNSQPSSRRRRIEDDGHNSSRVRSLDSLDVRAVRRRTL